jgi:ABC-2 type transport system ATP-binding protein
VTSVLQAQALGKKYGKRWALRECTIDIPAGHVVGLVGPNGAGKTTLLKLASGQLEPTAGSITVLGGRPGSTPAQLAKVGFVAQDTPVYATDRQSTYVIRTDAPIHDPAWTVTQLGLEDLVLAYMDKHTADQRIALEVQR